MIKVRSLILIGIILMLSTCTLLENDDAVDVSHVTYKLELNRFDSALYGVKEPIESRLADLRKKYPQFLNNTTDQFWINAVDDKHQKRLYSEVVEVIDFSNVRANLNISLKHLYYYYPDMPQYKVFTYISGLDFYNPIYKVDSAQILFIASDLYLGGNHPAYQQLDRYLAFYRNQRFLVSEVMEELALSLAKRDVEDQTLVNELIWWGKVLYFKEKCMPGVTDAINLRYADEHVSFCQNNKEQIWLYFVKNNLLFDSKEDTKRRFIRIAPFSKFYTDFDNQTPGMIGKWIGFEIVQSYMDNNPDVTLQQLMSNTDHQRIFTNSKYRP